MTNWDQIETEYVQGLNHHLYGKYYPTLKELAEKYEIAESTLRNKSSQNQWKQKRKKIQEKVQNMRPLDANNSTQNKTNKTNTVACL